MANILQQMAEIYCRLECTLRDSQGFVKEMSFDEFFKDES